jgi:hypothetical protein
MQIRDHKTEVSFAEALSQELLLKLNANGFYPAIDSIGDRVAIKFCSVTDYYVFIEEDGRVDICIQSDPKWWSVASKIVSISESCCITNPLYNPDSIINKIIKVVLFVDSLNDHMANVDSEWLAYGIDDIVNGSKTIHTKRTKSGFRIGLPVYESELVGFRPQVLCNYLPPTKQYSCDSNILY